MPAPRLRPGTPFQRRAGTDEVRTVTSTEPRRPVSSWHRVTWWTRHHLERTDDGEWRDESGWGGQRAPAPARPAGSYRARMRAVERDNAAVARHAQVLREEDAEAHRVGSRERADFYGLNAGGLNTRAEKLVRGGGTSAREEYERQQAEDYDRRVRARRGKAALRRIEQRRGAM